MNGPELDCFRYETFNLQTHALDSKDKEQNEILRFPPAKKGYEHIPKMLQLICWKTFEKFSSSEDFSQIDIWGA